MRNKNTVITGLICLGLVSFGHAQGFGIGGHGAYSTGGDVNESKIGFGAQVELALTEIISLEVAGTRFTDEDSDEGLTAEQTLTTIGASLILRLPLDGNLGLYGLGGLNYNMTDYDVTLPPEYAGFNVNIDADDKVGFHFGGGVRLALNENLTLFGEYRYTLLEMEGTVGVPQLGIRESIKEDYNFGLIKAGINLWF